MSKYKVSIVIPTFNYARFISQAIDSVLQQTFENVEIVVVDDGSTDETRETLAGYGARIKAVFQQNKGVSAARNTGVKNSTGDLIAFLDADDVWLSTKLEKQVRCFSENDGEVGFVHCGIQEFDAQGNVLDEFCGEVAEGWVANELLLLQPVVVGPGSTTILKREIFDQIGGFDERRILSASEDWEFCYRAAKVCKLKFVPEILVRYRNHGENRHLKLQNVEQSMLTAYREIFSQADKNTLELRRRAYGNFYTILAGSYFQAKNYPQFLKNTVKGLWYAPSNINRYLTYPKRLWKNGISRYNWVEK
ncbi:MAG: glycosyltransferase [Acidobacteriota bacterium]|nr:glycosyltransferase [Acidobacteriota bacterium]